MKSKGQYQLPKFRRGNRVNSPSGDGHITGIKYLSGVHWYEVKGTYYAETELKKL